MPHNLCSIFQQMPCISQSLSLTVQIMLTFFINHVLNLNTHPSGTKVKKERRKATGEKKKGVQHQNKAS